MHKGVVRNITTFGAFVTLDGFSHIGDGLVHIASLARRRVDKVEDVVSKGDTVWVKVMSIDNAGSRQKISLNMKDIDQSTGKDLDPDNSGKYSKGGHRNKEQVGKSDNKGSVVPACIEVLKYRLQTSLKFFFHH